MERNTTQLYDYQSADIDAIFNHIHNATGYCRMVYQLPTGGGKTVVFSEIAKRFIAGYGHKVAVLTHRKELCSQTSATLKRIGVANRKITSTAKSIQSDTTCYVAMVETLRNRIKAGIIKAQDVGLVIIDEAHHNSFRKLLGHYKNAHIIGVTATPFSSDTGKPMKRYYDTLVSGPTVADLIADGFLAQPQSFAYEVELNSLQTGLHGDYTVRSSNELYGSPAMLELLLNAYKERAVGKKTLIFNNGIDTSVKVYERFVEEGIAIRHLDHHTPPDERKAILSWFKKTKGAVLTSVSILTTGFDEPTVQVVILNRATTSITLYHQMIGRGSRRLPSKKTFRIIDLGNNIQRFGDWHEPVDWQQVFEQPEVFAQQLQLHATASGAAASHKISAALRALFPKTLEMAFDIATHYREAMDMGKKPRYVIRQSIRQQVLMCLENSDTLTHALELAEALKPEIEWRVKEYVKCLGNASKNYREWLLQDYFETLVKMISKMYYREQRIELAS